MRTEVSVYNEATGFVITSKNIGGMDFDGIDNPSSEWREAVANGIMLPISLVQDDSIGVSIVVDEPLTAHEDDNWVDHWTGRLVIDDGVLTITGGSEYLQGEEMDEYTEYVPILPGEYQADFYTYLPGVNGYYTLQAIPKSADSFGGGKEPYGAYFRRTRPSEEFPLWLQQECFDDPDQDPGHESEWDEDGNADDSDGPIYLDFLLHLTPVARLTAEQLPIPSAPIDRETGWVPQSVQPRKPALFPIGLLALNQERETEDGDD